MKVRRPGSNYLTEDGQVWHVPWFGSMAPGVNYLPPVATIRRDHAWLVG
jgi:hypothetical protein